MNVYREKSVQKMVVVRSTAIFNKVGSDRFTEKVAFDPRLNGINELSNRFWRNGILGSPEVGIFLADSRSIKNSMFMKQGE